jgi:hypothetical protein
MVRKRSQSRMVSKCCCMSSPDQVEHISIHCVHIAMWLRPLLNGAILLALRLHSDCIAAHRSLHMVVLCRMANPTTAGGTHKCRPARTGVLRQCCWLDVAMDGVEKLALKHHRHHQHMD